MINDKINEFISYLFDNWKDLVFENPSLEQVEETVKEIFSKFDKDFTNFFINNNIVLKPAFFDLYNRRTSFVQILNIMHSKFQSFDEMNFESSNFYKFLNKKFLIIFFTRDNFKPFDYFVLDFNKSDIEKAKIVYKDSISKLNFFLNNHLTNDKLSYTNDFIKESFNLMFHVKFENCLYDNNKFQLFFCLNEKDVLKKYDIFLERRPAEIEFANNITNNNSKNHFINKTIIESLLSDIDITESKVFFKDLKNGIWTNIPLSYFQNLPNKIRNICNYFKITTLKDLCFFPYEKFLSKSGVGKGSIEKLYNFIKLYVIIKTDEFNESYQDMIYNCDSKNLNSYDFLNDIKNGKIDISSILFKSEIGIIVNDLEFSNLNISNKLNNFVLQNNIKTLKEFLLLAIKNELGINEKSKTFMEAISLIDQNIFWLNDEKHILDFEKLIIKNFIKKINNKTLFYNDVFLMKIISNEIKLSDIKNLDWDLICSRLCSSDNFLLYCSGIVLNFLKCNKVCKYENLLNFMNNFFSLDLSKKIIDFSLLNKYIEFIDDEIFINYKKINTIVSNLEDNDLKKIISMRLEGATLDQIGREFNLTRERVRQKISLFFKKIKYSWESIYLIDFFEKYNVDAEVFCELAKLSQNSYFYLNEITNKGTDKIFGVVKDDNISNFIKKNALEYMKKIGFFINGIFIVKKRSNILDYLIDNYCINEISLSEFEKIYKNFLKQYNLSNQESLNFDIRYLENKLNSSTNILWKYKKNFRKFDILNFDMNKLMNFVNISNYMNMEISTEIFFKNSRDELLTEFDIWDEYEFHNLLKKYFDIFPDKNVWNIKFNRMPNIEIGDADRRNQVISLLNQEAPINKELFCEKYSEIYGTKIETVKANYLLFISEYCDGDILKIDFLDVDETEYRILKTKISERIHSFSEVLNIAKQIDNFNTDKINSFTLGKLGFKIYQNIIVPKKYSSLEKALMDEIFSKEIINFNDEYKFLFQNNSFNNLKAVLERKLKIVEFSKKNYINFSELQKRGLSKEKVLDFIKKAKDFSENEFFTIFSLKKKGFYHELFDLGFEDIFYNNLIKTHDEVKHRKLSNDNYLFKVSSNPIQLNDLIKSIIETKFIKIKIYELIDWIFKEFGILTNKEAIVSKIDKENGIWYDPIFDKVYINYNEYLKEIE